MCCEEGEVVTEVTDAIDVSAPAQPGVVPGAGTILTKFVDPLRIPPMLRPRSGWRSPQLTIRMRAAKVKLHSELPPTPLWTYEGCFPGPTIEVWRGQRLRVSWSNEIDSPMPLVAVEVVGPPNPLPQPGNEPGRDGATPKQEIAELPPWTAVHLHGAATNADNDGLPENAMLPSGAQQAEYPNDQPSTTLWYHDHAMDITRFNVMGGLQGMYIIRDEEEEALRLPRGDREIPLIICDRNLDTDADGRLTGQLLHKVAVLDLPTRPMIAFFGPYTLVNGVIWPYLDVTARWYRFRVLNSSNARTYRLFLLDEDGTVLHDAIKQIGTDGGLLPAPVSIADKGLILAPSERADILIDFSAFRGRNLRLVNTGGGPGDDGSIPPGQTRPEVGLVEPDVMQFRVSSKRANGTFKLPSTLSGSFRRFTHDSLPHDHEHRWIVSLVPQTSSHPELWEMEAVDPTTVTIPSDGVIQVRLSPDKVVTLKRVARRYEDAANFAVHHGAWEQWKFLNIGVPLHPLHIHLIRFQALSRDRYDTSTFNPTIGGTTSPLRPIGSGVLDPNEQGWKDTIRVGPDELISVAGQFTGGTGRYVYHCHILEHEDEGMMRPFVVMPKEVMAVKPHPPGSDHH